MLCIIFDHQLELKKGSNMQNAIFVDLPNLYTQLVKTDLLPAKEMRDYFLNWFDLDRLAESLLGFGNNKEVSIWVFYSHGRIGPSDARIDDIYLNHLISRLNTNKGVTARDVNIPGVQRESLRLVCENCGQNNSIIWNSEKGVDASLIVHLFDTMDSWEKAYLLSGDADYVPAVASLRRRGKVVNGAGFPSASTALVKECFEYINLVAKFFTLDIATYILFKEGGLIENWLKTATPNLRSNPTEKLLIGFDEFKNFSDEFKLHFQGNYDFSHCLKSLESLPKNSLKINIRENKDAANPISELTVDFQYLRFLTLRIPDNLSILSTKLGLMVSKRKLVNGYIDYYHLQYNWDEKVQKYELLDKPI
jgi:hypothetical protein